MTVHRSISIPDLVIRPAGVWDTRAPLFQFVSYHRIENQIYHSLILSVSKLLCEAHKQDQGLAASRLFDHKKSGQMATRAWAAYKKSFQQNPSGVRPQPTMKNAVDSLHSSIPSITEYAIVSYCGLFETYIQCWALNFLLAKLESGDAWTSTERKLAHAFSPLASPRLPSFIDICKYIPIIKETFNILPHVFVNPKTSKEVEAPITPNLNAFQTVLFWRDWRNLLVHTSGMVNQWFYKKHAMFFADFKSVFPHIRDIEVGKKLSLNDATFRAMATTHYRAARSLRPILVGISSARRGHIMAPGPASDSGKVNPEKLPERVPLMLMAGDHQASYRWTSDPGFRQVISSTLTGNSQARKAVSEA